MLDPTIGSEIRKTRPCVVMSPNEMNAYSRTVIVAPMTTAGRPYPWRVPCRFGGKSGYVVLDQIRTVDRTRLTGRAGSLSSKTVWRALSALQEMFTP